MELAGKKVMVVEDDEDVRSWIADFFRDRGSLVHEASGGRDALRALDAEPFSLVVTDLVMPDIEGIELIRIIRQKYPRLRVVAVSGGGRVAAGSYLDLAKHLGADQIMEKPFLLEDFERILTELPEAG